MNKKRIYNKKYQKIGLSLSLLGGGLLFSMFLVTYSNPDRSFGVEQIWSLAIFAIFPLLFAYWSLAGGVTFKKNKVRIVNVFAFYNKNINEIERFDFIQTGSIYPSEPVPGIILKNGKEISMTFMDDPTSLRFEQSLSKDNKKILETLNKELEKRKKYYENN